MNSGYISKTGKKVEQPADDVYKKPLPIDTINKFWGVDSRLLKHDDTVQKQSFDQSYRNFWSFVDFNTNYNLSNEQGGSGNFILNKNSANNSGNSKLSYMDARRKADELLRTGK